QPADPLPDPTGCAQTVQQQQRGSIGTTPASDVAVDGGSAHAPPPLAAAAWSRFQLMMTRTTKTTTNSRGRSGSASTVARRLKALTGVMVTTSPVAPRSTCVLRQMLGRRSS